MFYLLENMFLITYALMHNLFFTFVKNESLCLIDSLY